MILFARNRNSVDITGTLPVFLVPENTVFRCQKLKVGTARSRFTKILMIHFSFFDQSVAKW